MGEAECVVDCKAWLGEGPVWSPREGCLYWTDVPSYTVHRFNPSTGDRASWKMPEMVASMAIREKGGLILATTGGIDAWDPEEDRHVRLVEPEASLPANRSNDGKCDRRGRFWLGTMQNNLHPDGSDKGLTASTGNLYRIDADLSVHRMDSGMGISNTFAWSPDDRVMYFADTLVGMYAYDFDAETGAIENRRLFAKTDDETLGAGDGSTIDEEGFIWNARWGGGCLIRWAPDGSIDRTVKIPSRLVTSATFGGDDLDVLYVTTARYGVSERDLEEQPQAGGIFALEPGVKGIPEVPFAG